MMLTKWKRKPRFSRLFRDTRGNFAIMTAVILPAAIATVGLAIDFSRALEARTSIQEATDAAALSAASALVGQNVTADGARQTAKNIVVDHMAALVLTGQETADEATAIRQDIADRTSVDIAESGTVQSGKTYNVTVSTYYDSATTPMLALIGQDSLRVAASSSSESTTEAKNAISMYLVLDRSGSMAWDTTTVNASQPTKTEYYDCSYRNGRYYVQRTCSRNVTNYITKIDALKTAATALFDQLDTTDPDHKYVRTGAVSYTDTMQTPTAINWGTNVTRNYVSALPEVPTGGTSSTDAMNKAYTLLSSSTEASSQKSGGNKSFTPYIIFMTDGENTGNSSNHNPSIDTKTLEVCTKARNAGIQIYSVAFMAPDTGKSLLKSCAGTGNYYEADEMNSLVAAFKAIGEKATLTATRLTK